MSVGQPYMGSLALRNKLKNKNGPIESFLE